MKTVGAEATERRRRLGRDGCDYCGGCRGGTPGNENVVHLDAEAIRAAVKAIDDLSKHMRGNDLRSMLDAALAGERLLMRPRRVICDYCTAEHMWEGGKPIDMAFALPFEEGRA